MIHCCSQHSSGFIQCRCDYIFILNGLQECLSTTDILTVTSTYNSLSSSLNQRKKVILQVKAFGTSIAL